MPTATPDAPCTVCGRPAVVHQKDGRAHYCANHIPTDPQALSPPLPQFSPDQVQQIQRRIDYVHPPDYYGLQIASALLFVVAILNAIICPLVIVGGLQTEQPADYVVAGLMIGGLAIAFYGMSAACTALRDIARNSFRPPQK
ncbi:MAG: hypothetical protein ABSG31_04800 [Tepidisphaeraceae bacterium]